MEESSSECKKPRSKHAAERDAIGARTPGEFNQQKSEQLGENRSREGRIINRGNRRNQKYHTNEQQSKNLPTINTEKYTKQIYKNAEKLIELILKINC